MFKQNLASSRPAEQLSKHDAAITVLGAGNGGAALAAFLTTQGYQVVLYELPRFRQNITDLCQQNAIEATGIINGTCKLALVTDDIQAALSTAQVVFVVTHAAAHAELAKISAPFLKNAQTVALCPGYPGGLLEFLSVLNQNGCKANFLPVEFSVLPFPCLRKGMSVEIKGQKEVIMAAAYPSSRTGEALAILRPFFPTLIPAQNILATGLNETNIFIHSVIALFNIGRVEGKQPWKFYAEGCTPAIGKLIEELDAERLMLMRALGLNSESLAFWLKKFYNSQGMTGNDIYQLLTNFPPFQKTAGPQSVMHRYFSEDIAFGLVPLVELGNKLSTPVPLMESLLKLAESLTGINYRATGRTLGKMGLGNLDGPQLRKHLKKI